MARKTDEEYFNPPGSVAWPICNKSEIPMLDPNGGCVDIPKRVQVWKADPKRPENDDGLTVFYTTDTKFMNTLFHPNTVYETGLRAMAEMNYTLDREWPFYAGINPIGRKRHFSWMMQQVGISILVDLYVPEKWADFNLSLEAGVPKGFPSFATRGESGDIPGLEAQWKRALHHSGQDLAVFFVYGGGIRVQEWCIEQNQKRIENGESPVVYWFAGYNDILKYDFSMMRPDMPDSWEVQRPPKEEK